MNWFVANAPIRRKMLVVFGTMASFTAAAPLAAVVVPSLVLPIGLGATICAILAGAWFRKAICDPYVTTVVRMEALAAGDLESPIQFTGYQDCVGRMTKAMFAFRDAAAKQIRANEEAERHGAIVRGMTGNLRRLADGDLTADIVEDYPGAYAELKANFNAALGSLRTLIGAVGESSAMIRTGANEIANASEQLARRTESNAASLEQTSAAIAQIDGRLQAAANAAGRTVAQADGALGAVNEGREVTDRAVQAMERVSASAEGIDSVIEGLDKIAFQTRVLAMNAAVEAGRAGEAGRGFAVVADLVSALAMRAEEEAKRAREQLTVTQSEIVGAVAMVHRVDEALVGISSGVREVNELLGGMADDNRVQSAAISEISSSVSTMDTATQQNAAMVEETSAATRKLREEIEELSRQAERFRLADGGLRRPAQGNGHAVALTVH